MSQSSRKSSTQSDDGSMDLDQLDTRDNSTSSSSDSWSNDDAPEPTSTQLPKINTQSPKRKRSKDKNEKPKKKQKTSPQSSQKSKKRTSPIKQFRYTP
jgi:hypothetical protein